MKLKMHMKSGKTIVVSRVKHWSLDYNGNEIIGLRIKRRRTFKRWFYGLFNKPWSDGGLIMGSLDLSQIEAIEKGGVL